MKSAMPGADGFSPRNLRYCQRFYELYKAEENLPQLVAELGRIELRIESGIAKRVV